MIGKPFDYRKFGEGSPSPGFDVTWAKSYLACYLSRGGYGVCTLVASVRHIEGYAAYARQLCERVGVRYVE